MNSQSLNAQLQKRSHSGSSSGSFSSTSKKYEESESLRNSKFKDILGQGRSGKTLLCDFRKDTIALKCIDLWKSRSYILKEMQNENVTDTLNMDNGILALKAIHDRGVLHNDIREEYSDR
ncbi:hypothetical protein C1646_757386 [Rhizophagus diaphanus]|nr:hypothetical protein C1646_757386 [Rhizophagus diaphanus] [Rhizophagus sp. MUCL 43196]